MWDIIEAYAQLFENNLDRVTTVSRWKNENTIAEDSLPLIYIEPSSTLYTPNTRYDSKVQQLQIGVVISAKDTAWDIDPTCVAYKKRLVCMVEDSTEMSTDKRSIIWLIQNNSCLKLGGVKVANEVTDVRVQYSLINTDSHMWYRAIISLNVLSHGVR